LRVDEASRARIEGCDDTELLNRWIERAATATSVDEVFGPSSDAESSTSQRDGTREIVRAHSAS
jgi:hypothetical protein